MIPRVEFGHLYKFIVSIGLALAAASLIVPWAVLRESSVLLVPVSELDDLTPTARLAIEEKQGHVLRVVELYPVACLVALVLGLLIAGFGVFLWWRRQRVLDQREDLDLEQQIRGLRPLSPPEIEEGRWQEAIESAEEELVSRRAGSGGPAGNAGAPAEVEAVPNGPSSSATQSRPQIYRDHRDTYVEIEDLLTQKVRQALGRTHDVVPQMKDGPGRPVARADIVALSTRDPLPDIVIEVKYGRDSFGRKRINDALIQTALMAERVGRASRRRIAQGLVIFVLEADAQLEQTRAALAENAQRASMGLQQRVGFLVLSRDELPGLSPSRLREEIGEAIRMSDLD